MKQSALSINDATLLLSIQKIKRERHLKSVNALSSLSIERLRELADNDNDVAEKLLCERSFVDFFKLSWPYMDPSPYLHNWHIDAICEHLQAAYEKKIQRLIINIPPRCAKSLICSVAFPAWIWCNSPERRFLSASHSMKLSIRDNVKCRRLINSEFYRKHWGNLFYFSDDQNAKTRFENSKFGYKSITSVGANTTGDGGDVIMIDDPSDAGEILSDVKKEAVIDWFDGTMSSRANNINDAIWVLIMQRLDEKDLTGHLLKSGKWEHLSIPMEYEGDKKVTCLGWEDPRSELGELMWPEKFDEKSISAMKAQMNPYSYAGQMQQRPVPREGGLIKLSEIKYYKELPEVKRYYWSWDLAVKTGQYNDYSVGQYWAECENGHYLVYMFRQKVEYPTLRQHLKMLCEQYRASEVLIEEKSSGEPLIQELKKHSSLPIISIIPGRDIPGSKEERVIMCSPLFEAGKIYIPEKAEWISGLVEEWVRFPKSAHDDTVDAMSQYLCRRIKKGSSMNKKVVIIG